MDAPKTTDNRAFWLALDRLFAESEFVLERPRGSAHLRFPDFIHPLDYGYLSGTTASDGAGIDVWRGSDAAAQIVGVICTVDLLKRDSEIKVLVGCTDDEIESVFQVHNTSEYQKGILIRRPND